MRRIREERERLRRWYEGFLANIARQLSLQEGEITFRWGTPAAVDPEKK
jgi:hypothetical protein